jgi:hypothetical protein
MAGQTPRHYLHVNSHFFNFIGLYLKILVFFWLVIPAVDRFIAHRPELNTRSAFYGECSSRGIAMSKLITTKSVTVAAAAAIAAGMAIFMTVAFQAKAPTQVTSAVVERILAKGAQLRPLVKGAACSARSWPNYEQTCQFDLRTSADHVRPVRVLDLERARNPLNVVIASR